MSLSQLRFPCPPLVPAIVPYHADDETDQLRKEVEHTEEAGENQKDSEVEDNSDHPHRVVSTEGSHCGFKPSYPSILEGPRPV